MFSLFWMKRDMLWWPKTFFNSSLMEHFVLSHTKIARYNLWFYGYQLFYQFDWCCFTSSAFIFLSQRIMVCEYDSLWLVGSNTNVFSIRFGHVNNWVHHWSRWQAFGQHPCWSFNRRSKPLIFCPHIYHYICHYICHYIFCHYFVSIFCHYCSLYIFQ